jgi:hypothetical protein
LAGAFEEAAIDELEALGIGIRLVGTGGDDLIA